MDKEILSFLESSLSILNGQTFSFSIYDFYPKWDVIFFADSNACFLKFDDDDDE